MSLENVTSSLTLDMRIRNAGKRNRPIGDEKKLDENREAGGRPLLNRSCRYTRGASRQARNALQRAYCGFGGTLLISLSTLPLVGAIRNEFTEDRNQPLYRL
jgi:hypothetical protein